MAKIAIKSECNTSYVSFFTKVFFKVLFSYDELVFVLKSI